MRVFAPLILSAGMVGAAAGADQLAPARIAVRIVTRPPRFDRARRTGLARPLRAGDLGRGRLRVDARPDRPEGAEGSGPHQIGFGPGNPASAADGNPATVALGDVWVQVSGATSVVRVHVG